MTVRGSLGVVTTLTVWHGRDTCFLGQARSHISMVEEIMELTLTDPSPDKPLLSVSQAKTLARNGG